MDLTQFLAGALVGVLLATLVIKRELKPKSQAELVAAEINACKKQFAGLVGVEYLRHEFGMTHTLLIDGNPIMIIRDPYLWDAEGFISSIRKRRGL